jgi:hypothetical protein
MNSRDPLPKGMVGFVDYLIITWKYIVFIECKFEETKDKFSGEQEMTQKLLLHHSALEKHVHYFIVKNLADAQKIRDGIIQEDL